MKSKPFPWRCPNCAKKEVYAVIVPYIAKIKHNEYLYDVNVSELNCAKCNSCGEITFNADSDEQIIKEFRKQILGEISS